VGTSADSPNEGAVVVEVSGNTRASIPATLDGVRTRVIYSVQSGAATSITAAAIESAATVKNAHEGSFMGQAGIRGIGVGRSDDNPAETAIVIYTLRGVAHPPIPAVIDGMRTKVIEGAPFRAQ
jgi:hypothetical protein